jgi:hypothetical protein
MLSGQYRGPANAQISRSSALWTDCQQVMITARAECARLEQLIVRLRTVTASRVGSGASQRLIADYERFNCRRLRLRDARI